MSVLERCPSYRESNKGSKERQGPTLGVRFTEVSVLQRCPLRESRLYRAARLQTSNGFLCSVFPSFESGVVLITMQRTHPVWHIKTKLRMTLDWSRIAKKISMVSGIFAESRRQTLLYSCKR